MMPADLMMPMMPGGGYASDAYVAGIVGEDLFGGHGTYRGGYAGAHEVNHAVSEEDIHEGYDDEPYQERAAADDEGVFESDDVAQAEYCRSYIYLYYKFGIGRYLFAPWQHSGCECLGPPSESRDDEVVDTSDQTAEEQGLGTFASRLPAD